MTLHRLDNQVTWGRTAAIGALLVLAGGSLGSAQPAAPPLVTVEQALRSTQPVQVAAVVDPGTVVAGDGSVAFVATGPSGERLPVELTGKLPPGFAVASTVVLVGTGGEDRFRASAVLVPQRVDGGEARRGLTAVTAVTMVVWFGLFLYVYRLDRRLRQLEV